jgi:hypothetical protein
VDFARSVHAGRVGFRAKGVALNSLMRLKNPALRVVGR